MPRPARRAFGQELDAILGMVQHERAHQSNDMNHEVKMVMVQHIRPGRFQPRKYFDEQALSELAQSIQSQGLLQPIAVRQFGKEYEIVAGERRWRAAQKAGLQQVPVVVCQMTDESAQALGLIENIQRENLNPIEEAEAFYRLIEELGLTHDEVAERVGKSRSSITNFIRLLKLEKDVQQALINKKIEMGHAKVLLALTGDQQKSATQMIISRHLSVRQTEALVHKTVNPKNDGVGNSVLLDKQENAIKAFSELFDKHVKVTLKKDGTEQGRVQFTFRSFNELDELYDKLTGIRK